MLAVAFPTYSLLKRHEKKLETILERLGKMRSSEPVTQVWKFLNAITEFIELYENLERENNAAVLERE